MILFSYGLDSVLSQVALWGKGKICLKKYQTDSHVIYGTLRLEIFTKYPFITQESTLFAELRLYKGKEIYRYVKNCFRKIADYVFEANNNL